MRILGPRQRLCDGATRRDFLRFGALGALALASGARAAELPGFGRARRCVMLFLTGGPPQLDTFDPKPDAPVEIRGETRTIPTRIPGVRFGDLFPNLARQAHRLQVVRNVTHADTTHTSAGYSMLTGVVHPTPNVPDANKVRPNPNDHPHVGSLLAMHRPPLDGLPTFVALPEVIKDAAVNEFPGQSAGFLGKRFDPFRIEADEAKSGFKLPEIVLPDDMTGPRLGERRALLNLLDQSRRAGERSGTFDDLDGACEQAWRMVGSRAITRALRLDQEPRRTRDAYGPHLFGQGCLLARRLLEAGVPLVTVYWHYEGPDDSPVWDTHENNFRHLRTRLAPPADQAAACLIDDLATRGLLDDTLVIVMGEFGRSPKVNKQGGREHWPQAQSILLAGAGPRGGSVVGATDRTGGHPAGDGIAPADLTATFLHLLGVPADLDIVDRTGRPLRACTGRPVKALIG